MSQAANKTFRAKDQGDFVGPAEALFTTPPLHRDTLCNALCCLLRRTGVPIDV